MYPPDSTRHPGLNLDLGTRSAPIGMEISLSLDEHGRTRCDEWGKMDYAPNSISTNVSSLPCATLDDLLFDAEIADCALMPRTFWMPAAVEESECWMEQLAQQIFQYHTRRLTNYDPATSGAEWWVQIRPSPPNMGRYDLLVKDDDENSKNSVSFHWDKDEDLRILAGGNLYVHPHISTVTYLTNLGAPTMVIDDYRIDNVTGDWLVPDQKPKAVVSWPRTGKHLSFDGRLLHAAPIELMQDQLWEQQIKVPSELDESFKKLQSRRNRRVTFLVNIWLNYKPFNIERFPMPEKMTKAKPDFKLFQGDLIDKVKEVDIPETTNILSWPMGACDTNECIQIKIDRSLIQAQDSIDTFKLTWLHMNGIVLMKSDNNRILEDGEGMKRDRNEGNDDDDQINAKKAATGT